MIPVIIHRIIISDIERDTERSFQGENGRRKENKEEKYRLVEITFRFACINNKVRKAEGNQKNKIAGQETKPKRVPVADVFIKLKKIIQPDQYSG